MKLENIKPGVRVELKKTASCHVPGDVNTGVVSDPAFEVFPDQSVLVWVRLDEARLCLIHPDGLRRERTND